MSNFAPGGNDSAANKAYPVHGGYKENRDDLQPLLDVRRRHAATTGAIIEGVVQAKQRQPIGRDLK
jgi:hypothetical protein